MEPSEHKWWTLLAVSIATFMLLLALVRQRDITSGQGAPPSAG